MVFTIHSSLVTPYAPYTVYVLAYTALGVALGSVFGAYDIVHAGALFAAIWFGLEGLHAIDLADEGVAVRLHNPTAAYIGYGQVALGGALGVWLASQTTWRFLVLVAAGTLFGLAYNEEWFGGYLHDRDKITGLANFGLSWGAVPYLAGVSVVYPGFLGWSGAASPAQSLGLLLVGAAIAIDAVRLNYLEGHGAIPRYEDVGIEHDRDHKSSCAQARSACHQANVMMIPSWVLLAVAGHLIFVV